MQMDEGVAVHLRYLVKDKFRTYTPLEGPLYATNSHYTAGQEPSKLRPQHVQYDTYFI